MARERGGPLAEKPRSTVGTFCTASLDRSKPKFQRHVSQKRKRIQRVVPHLRRLRLEHSQSPSPGDSERLAVSVRAPL